MQKQVQNELSSAPMVLNFFVGVYSAEWHDSWVTYAFLGLFCLFHVLNLSDLVRKFFTIPSRKNDSLHLVPILTFLLICFVVIFSKSFSAQMLYPVRFIEARKDASWYILHNDSQKTDSTQEISGISARDLQKLKAVFSPLSPQKACTPFDNRPNALFGYMAWNLGQTKVFCPVSFRNNWHDEAEKPKSGDACLVINSQYLQPLSAGYISSK